MRRPSHLRDLQGKEVWGGILMLLDPDWSEAKATWLPAKFDWVILNTRFVLWHFYTQNPQCEPLSYHPSTQLNVHGNIPNWILTNELEILSQLHLHQGCVSQYKLNEEKALTLTYWNTSQTLGYLWGLHLIKQGSFQPPVFVLASESVNTLHYWRSKHRQNNGSRKENNFTEKWCQKPLSDQQLERKCCRFLSLTHTW